MVLGRGRLYMSPPISPKGTITSHITAHDLTLVIIWLKGSKSEGQLPIIIIMIALAVLENPILGVTSCIFTDVCAGPTIVMLAAPG